jgi:ribosomal protein S18 acetylase RimI-like enzyme
MSSFTVRAAKPYDREAILAMLYERWGGETMVVRETIYHLADLPAFVAGDGDEIVGLVTYVPGGAAWEILSLDSLIERQGLGSALLARVERAAREGGASRVTLVTTNDNLEALRFYQRRGYRLMAVDSAAVDRARRLKPAIPAIGLHGIPIHDELTLVKDVDADQ